MGSHTTDEVYARLEEVKQQLEKNSTAEVTTAHFDSKIAELKTVIQNGGKKPEDEKKEAKKEEKSGWDVLKEKSPIKDLLDLVNNFLAAFRGSDIITKTVLFYGAVTGAVALFVKIRTMVLGVIEKLKSFLTTVKNATLKVTGLVRGNRQYFGRDRDGNWGMQPEHPEPTTEERRATQRAAARRFRQRGRQRGSDSSGLPSATDARSLEQSLSRVNSSITTLDELKSKLPSAASMKRTASAAGKLSSALGKVTERLRPAALDELTEATGRLHQKVQALDAEKLPRTLHAVSDAAKELNRNAEHVRTMFRDLASSATDAANAIA
ncbi:hypothetical protein [Streptomyces sp. CL12]|uniref:hypothetical protein n=1 Tax=Streptomyces sp. CL12 TaxID=3391744 RepID=UPI003A8071D4